METNFNFKSQICTTREQSERLLALGLKPETADCYWRLQPYYNDEGFDCGLEWSCDMGTFLQDDAHELFLDYIPAWSLHRLWISIPKYIELGILNEYEIVMTHGYLKVINDFADVYKYFDDKDSIYDNIIDCIEWLIKEGYFNEDYLV